MDNAVDVKVRRRPSVGGIFCIAVALYMLVAALVDFAGGAWSTLEFFRYNSEISFEYGLYRLVEPVGNALISGANGLALLLFGILLVARVHSKLLVLYPVLKVVLVFGSLGYSVVGSIWWLLMFGTVKSFPIFNYSVSFVFTVILAAMWVLAAVAVLKNCQKDRSPSDEGKMAFMRWLLPVWYVLYHMITYFIPAISEITSGGYLPSYFTNIFLRILGSGENVYWLVNGLALTCSGLKQLITAACAGAIMYLCMSWVISPYKKEK